MVALIGANGAGKSTLMKATRSCPRLSGDIRLGSRSVGGQRTHEIARMGVALVPEGRGTLRTLTVRENLLLGGFFGPATKCETHLMKFAAISRC